MKLLEAHTQRKTKIVRTTFAGILINVVLYIFLYLGQVLIIRGLDRTEYSTFIVALSFISLSALFADLGLTSLFIKMFAEAEERSASGKDDQRGEILGTLLIFRGIMCLLIAISVFFLPSLLGYDERTQSVMKILIIIVFISSRLLTLRNVAECFAMGRSKYVVSSSFALVDSIFFAVALFLWGTDLTIYSATWIYALSNLPGFILLSATIMIWSFKDSVRIRFSLAILSKIFRHALPLILGTAFLTIFNNLDPLLLDKWSNPYQVSAFGASLRIMTGLGILPMVLVNIVAPEVTKRLIREDHIHTHGMVDKVLRALLCFAGAIALIISSTSGTLTTFLLGKGYADASPLIVYLGWMFIPMAFSTFVIEIGIAGGSFWGSTTFRFLLMIITLAGDIILIKDYGAEGAIIARTVAIIFGVIILMYMMKKFIAVNEKLFYTFLLRFAVCLSLPIGITLLLMKMRVSEIVTAVCVLIVYALLIFLFKAITKNDIHTVWHGIINRKE